MRPHVLFAILASVSIGASSSEDSNLARQKRQSIDFSQSYQDPDTGLQCIDKDAIVQTKEREKLLECTHSNINICHYTYVTKFKSQRQDECKDNYEKICSISFKLQARNETIEKCYRPMVQKCDDGVQNNEILNPNDNDVTCKTVFESECTTRYVEKQPGKFVGETKCQKVPKQLCGKSTCQFVPGPEECHNKTVASGIDTPEEICDLVPQKTCKGVYKLVPFLAPEAVCKDVPREVCSFGFSSEKVGEKPIVTKWCYDPREGGDPFAEIEQARPSPPRQRGPSIGTRPNSQQQDFSPQGRPDEGSISFGSQSSQRRPEPATQQRPGFTTDSQRPRPGSSKNQQGPPRQRGPSIVTRPNSQQQDFYPQGRPDEGSISFGSQSSQRRPEPATQQPPGFPTDSQRQRPGSSRDEQGPPRQRGPSIVTRPNSQQQDLSPQGRPDEGSFSFGSQSSQRRPEPATQQTPGFPTDSQRPRPGSSRDQERPQQFQENRQSSTQGSGIQSGGTRSDSQNNFRKRPGQGPNSVTRLPLFETSAPFKSSQGTPSPLLPVTKRPSSEILIGTVGPNDAPIYDDIIYDLEEDVTPPYSVNIDVTTPATTPVPTPPSQTALPGVASSDINDPFGDNSLDTRSGRTSLKTGDNFEDEPLSAKDLEELNKVIAEYEEQFHDAEFEAGDIDFDTIDDSNDPSHAQFSQNNQNPSQGKDKNTSSQRSQAISNTQSIKNKNANTGKKVITFRGQVFVQQPKPGTRGSTSQTLNGSLKETSGQKNILSFSQREQKSSSISGSSDLETNSKQSTSFQANNQRDSGDQNRESSFSSNGVRLGSSNVNPNKHGTKQFKNSLSAQSVRPNKNTQHSENKHQTDPYTVNDHRKSKQSSLDDDENLEFDPSVHEDLDTILDQVNNKNNLKVTRVKGKVSNGSGKSPLARVIKHKKPEKDVSKTVIISNTPEAFKAFGIKNVPKNIASRTKKFRGTQNSSRAQGESNENDKNVQNDANSFIGSNNQAFKNQVLKGSFVQSSKSTNENGGSSEDNNDSSLLGSFNAEKTRNRENNGRFQSFGREQSPGSNGNKVLSNDRVKNIGNRQKFFNSGRETDPTSLRSSPQQGSVQSSNQANGLTNNKGNSFSAVLGLNNGSRNRHEGSQSSEALRNQKSNNLNGQTDKSNPAQSLSGTKGNTSGQQIIGDSPNSANVVGKNSNGRNINGFNSGNHPTGGSRGDNFSSGKQRGGSGRIRFSPENQRGGSGKKSIKFPSGEDDNNNSPVQIGPTRSKQNDVKFPDSGTNIQHESIGNSLEDGNVRTNQKIRNPKTIDEGSVAQTDLFSGVQPPAISLGPIKIEETFPEDFVNDESRGDQNKNYNEQKNPFLKSPAPNKVISQGKPSWTKGDIQPVETPPNSRPIVFVNSNGKTSLNSGTVTFPGNSQSNPVTNQINTSSGNNKQIPRKPKLQSSDIVLKNPNVANIQQFAVPNNPPGPSRQELLRNQQKIVLQNTIKTHQKIIKPSQQIRQNENGSLQTKTPFSFPNKNVNNQALRNPESASPPSSNQFNPPVTLLYGFKPMTTPSFNRPTPPTLSTQGRFSPPITLMYGFSPLASSQGDAAGVTSLPPVTSPLSPQAPLVAPVTFGPQPAPVLRGNSHGNSIDSSVPLIQVRHESNKPKKRKRSMMEFISDMLQPLTSPIKKALNL